MWNDRSHLGHTSSARWLRTERRQAQRIELRHRDAWIRIRGLGELTVADLSACGVGVHLGEDDARAWMEGPVQISLAGSVIRATGAPTSPALLPGGKLRLGLRLGGMSPRDLSTLSDFLLDEHDEQQEGFERFVRASDAVTSHDAEHIERLLRAQAAYGNPPLMVFDGDRRLDVRLRVERVDRARGLWARTTEGHALRAGRRYGMVAPGHGAACAFRAGLRAVNGDRLTFAFPVEVVQSGFRDARCRLSAHGGLHVAFSHPELSRTVSKTALEVSSSGLSVAFDARGDLFVLGEQLRDMRLVLPGRALSAHGIVRRVQREIGGSFGVCGIELVEFSSAADQAHWQRFVFGQLHPRLSADAGHAHALGWEVLRRSGYMDQWTDLRDRGHLEREYERFWRDAAGAGGTVVTLMEGTRPVASIASSALWPRTWMTHQLGVDASAREDKAAFLSCTRELYSGLLYELQRQTDLEYLAMYMEADKGWNDFIYGGFARIYAKPDQLRWSRMRVYRGRTDQSVSVAATDRLVRVATEGDRQQLAATYARICSPLEVDAMELHAESLRPDGFIRQFAGMGHGRGRASYVFAPEGTPLWGLVCETGSEGANVFGLLNRCWLTPLAPCDSRVASAARRSLMRQALRHFAEAEKRTCLLFEAPEAAQDDPLSVGFTHVSEGAVWLSRREVLPAWLAYVDNALSLQRSRTRRAA